MLTNGLHDLPPGKVAMVVTHLEMRSRPDMPSTLLPEGVTFRPVAADVAWFRDIFDRVGTADWLWYGRRKLTDPQLMAILDEPDVAHFTLSKDGIDEALLELDFRQPDECELAFFGLTRALIGTGSGRYLMARATELAWSQPIDRFHVHTCTFDSPQALEFYRRSGFVPTRQQVEIDDDPRLTGLVPRGAAPHLPIFEG